MALNMRIDGTCQTLPVLSALHSTRRRHEVIPMRFTHDGGVRGTALDLEVYSIGVLFYSPWG